MSEVRKNPVLLSPYEYSIIVLACIHYGLCPFCGYEFPTKAGREIKEHLEVHGVKVCF